MILQHFLIEMDGSIRLVLDISVISKSIWNQFNYPEIDRLLRFVTYTCFGDVI